MRAIVRERAFDASGTRGPLHLGEAGVRASHARRTAALLSVALLFSLGCALEWPRLGPTPCGAVGQRCCEGLDDGGASVAAGGCDTTSYCLSTSDAGTGGTCRACPTGRIACNNRCVDTTSDSDHCGACGAACPVNERCVRSVTDAGVSAGACTHVCPTLQTWCDAAMSCVALSSTVEHCGRCGNACSFANASASCLGGTCRMNSCATGFGNCDSLADNGCETPLTTDARNCGSCRRACSPSAPNCVAGSCVP